jgi:hypothetical protein
MDSCQLLHNLNSYTNIERRTESAKCLRSRLANLRMHCRAQGSCKSKTGLESAHDISRSASILTCCRETFSQEATSAGLRMRWSYSSTQGPVFRPQRINFCKLQNSRLFRSNLSRVFCLTDAPILVASLTVTRPVTSSSGVGQSNPLFFP